MPEHYCESLAKDADGWWVATCHCGWTGFPAPAADDAADVYAEHRIERALAARP